MLYYYQELLVSGRLDDTFDLIHQQTRPKAFDYEFNTSEGIAWLLQNAMKTVIIILLLSTRKTVFVGAILANNHQRELFLALEELLKYFQHEGLAKWKQMKCVELAMALLDEDLIANGVSINPESGKIDWLMSKQMEPPANDGNKKKSSKSSVKNITGGKARPGNVFGQLVNDVQSVLASQMKFKAPTKELRASTSSTNNLPDLDANNTCGTGGRAKGAPKRCEAASI